MYRIKWKGIKRRPARVKSVPKKKNPPEEEEEKMHQKHKRETGKKKEEGGRTHMTPLAASPIKILNDLAHISTRKKGKSPSFPHFPAQRIFFRQISNSIFFGKGRAGRHHLIRAN